MNLYDSKILLVDDNYELSAMIRNILRNLHITSYSSAVPYNICR